MQQVPMAHVQLEHFEARAQASPGSLDGFVDDAVDVRNTHLSRFCVNVVEGDRVSAFELVSSSPKELDTLIRSEMDRLTPLIKQLELKAD